MVKCEFPLLQTSSCYFLFTNPFSPQQQQQKTCQLSDLLTGYTSKKFISVFYIQENLEVIFKFKQTGRKDNEKWTIFSLRFCSFSIPEMTSPSLLSFSLSQDIVSLCNPWVAYMFSFFHCHHHYYHYHFGVKLTMG